MTNKYLEELDGGDAFGLKNQYYIVTNDYKKSGHRMCVGLSNGHNIWLAGNSIVESVQLFTLDNESNFIAIKETKKHAMD